MVLCSRVFLFGDGGGGLGLIAECARGVVMIGNNGGKFPKNSYEIVSSEEKAGYGVDGGGGSGMTLENRGKSVIS